MRRMILGAVMTMVLFTACSEDDNECEIATKQVTDIENEIRIANEILALETPDTDSWHETNEFLERKTSELETKKLAQAQICH